MPKTKNIEDPEAEWSEADDVVEDVEPDDIDVDDAIDVEDEIDVDAEIDVDDEIDVATADDTDEVVADDTDDDDEALDELEAEELEMLTDDEAAETIIVDEAAEMRALRREELALDVDPEVASPDEFVCQSCFLVKRTSQLADKRKKICTDCAS